MKNEKRLNADIPEDLFKRVKSEASLQGLSMKEYILMALLNQMNRNEKDR